MDQKELSLATLFVGVWAVIPAVVSPAINTDQTAEFVDHVIPGMVLLAVASARLWLSDANPAAWRYGALAVLGAGWFMAATHLPLVVQATQNDAPWDATIHHSLPAGAAFLIGLTWFVRVFRSTRR